MWIAETQYNGSYEGDSKEALAISIATFCLESELLPPTITELVYLDADDNETLHNDNELMIFNDEIENIYNLLPRGDAPFSEERRDARRLW